MVWQANQEGYHKMLIGLVMVSLTSWGLTKLIIRKWPRWWVALLTICAVFIVVYFESFALAFLHGNAVSGKGLSMRMLGQGILFGTVITIWTAINALNPKRNTAHLGQKRPAEFDNEIDYTERD